MAVEPTCKGRWMEQCRDGCAKGRDRGEAHPGAWSNTHAIESSLFRNHPRDLLSIYEQWVKPQDKFSYGEVGQLLHCNHSLVFQLHFRIWFQSSNVRHMSGHRVLLWVQIRRDMELINPRLPPAVPRTSEQSIHLLHRYTVRLRRHEP